MLFGQHNTTYPVFGNRREILLTNWTPRELSVPLDFLGAGSYTPEIYQDGVDVDTQPKHVTLRKQVVRKGEVVKLHLAKGGGCAIRFIPYNSK
jgi:alpha-glucosidase